MGVSHLTKVGIAREASWGSSTDPAVLLPVEPPSFTVPHEQILDQGIRGSSSMDYGAYQGAVHVEASLESMAFPEEIGYLLFGILGSCSTSGTAAPYVHTFSLNSNPPSFSIQDENGVQTYRYTGCMINSLTLSFNIAEGAVHWSADFMGKEKGSASGSIPAEATTPPFLGWQATAAIGATSPYGKVTEAELTIAREVVLGYVDGNAQTPGTAYSGPMEVTGSCTLLFDSNDDYDRYLDKTQEKLAFTFSQGSGASKKELVLTMTKADFGDGAAEIDRSGSNLTLAYTVRALYNPTDGGPIKVKLTNSKSSY